MSGTRIGDMNGRWAMLLKVTLVGIPCLTSLFLASFIPWAVWVTGNIYTSRQIVEVVRTMQLEAKTIDTRIDNLPPEEWKARIRVLEDDSKQNLKDHQMIIISLEQIKTAVGAVKVEPK